MKRRMNQGFTLVEIMIVVAIIALLAAIAIPNLLRARVNANEALAQSTLRAISTAIESYVTASNGSYPTTLTTLINATPPYLSINYCDGASRSGYTYDCTGMSSTAYTIAATADTAGTSGTSDYTIATGGVLAATLAQ